MMKVSPDRAAYMLAWIGNAQKKGTCSCGHIEGHTGWLVCLQRDYEESG